MDLTNTYSTIWSQLIYYYKIYDIFGSNEKNYIEYILNNDQKVINKIIYESETSIIGEFDYFYVPQIVLLISNIISDNLITLKKNNIDLCYTNIDISLVVMFFFNILFEIKIFDDSFLDKNTINCVLDTSLSLLKKNINNDNVISTPNSKSCFNFFC